MGLFSFLKKSGKKVRPKSAPSAEEMNRATLNALQNEVRDLNVDVEGLNISLDDDTVTVEGTCKSQSDREKVILALGNVEYIAKVQDNLNVENPEPESQFYEVKSGDSLSKIAQSFYGDAKLYNSIFEANQPMLKDANLIYPGQVLRIPPLDQKK